jgi:hypothetical protein
VLARHLDDSETRLIRVMSGQHLKADGKAMA